MPIAARCPNCDTQFQLSDGLDGKLVRCKKCQALFVVGGPGRAYPPPQPSSARGEGVERGASAARGEGIQRGSPAREEAEARSGIRARRDDRYQDDNPEPPPAPAIPRKWLIMGGAIGGAAFLFIGLLVTAVSSLQSLEKKSPAAPRPSAELSPSPSLGSASRAPAPKPEVAAPRASSPANPPVPGSIRPQVTAPFEPASEADERPAQLPPPALWQVKLDAAPDTATKGEAGGLRVTKAPIQLPGLQRTICPTTPSSFVAVGGSMRAGAGVQAFNLQTLKPGKRLAIPTGLVEPVALSPDGVLLAGKAGPAAGLTSAIIDVWSFNTGKRVQALTLPEGARAKIELVDFARPGQLVVMKTDLGKRNLQVWDIEKGEVVREWIGPSTFQPNSAALSPGRKYLAAGEKDKLWIYDLDAGTVAAEVDISGPSKQFWKYECYGLAFSPDGAELAGVFETPFKSRLLCWDVAKGELLADHLFDKRLHWNYKGPPVEWLPDRTAILVYGKNLIEHQTGRLVYEVPGMGAGSDRQIRVVGSDRLLETLHSFQGVALQILPLPKEQLEGAIEATRKAWAALNLPAAPPGNLSEARVVAQPAQVKWSVAPDAAIVKSDRFTSRPVALLQRESDVQRVLFSNSDTAVAAVLSAVTPNQLFSKKVLRAERYDLTRGQSLGGVNLCVDPQYRAGLGVASDLSGDGSRLVLKGRQDPRRVDVWSLSEGKHIAAWTPYPTAAAGGQAESVTWVGFLGSKRVFTLNDPGKLILWSLPEAKAIYALNNVIKDSPTLSAGERYLAVAQDGAYRLYEADTGVAVGTLEWPALASTPAGTASASAAFSRDGAQFAALTGGTLTCWDLKTAMETCSFAVGQGLSGLRWASPHFLVARAAQGAPLAYLINTEQQLVLCSYALPGSNVPVGSPDGRLWYLHGTANQSHLVARGVPDAAALQIEALARNPVTPLLWKPGMPVSVRVDVAGNDAARLQIVDALQQRLQAAGFKPADGASAVLSFYASLTGTDESLKYSRLGPPSGGASTVSVPIQKLTSTASLGDNRGNSWWKQDISAKTSGAPVEMNRQDEDLNSRFQNRLWQSAVQFASQLQLPSRVYLVNGQPLALPAPISLMDGR